MKISKKFVVQSILYTIFTLYIDLSWGAEGILAPDRMLEINGKRTFILGLYNPKMDTEEELQILSEAGFNLISVGMNEADFLKAQKHGLFVWVNIHGMWSSENEEEQISKLTQYVEFCKRQPSFLVWEMPDEALWNVYLRNYEAKRYKELQLVKEKISNLSDEFLRKELEPKVSDVVSLYSKWLWKEGEDIMSKIWERIGEQSPFVNFSMSRIEEFKDREFQTLYKAYTLLKRLDSAHPVWMNFAPRNSMESLRRFAQCADIVGCDIYPVPMYPKLRHSDLMDQTMACVGAYTRRMQEIDPYKPVWMVLQGFDWGSLQGEIYERSGKEQEGFRAPTLQELRFMGFDCIVNGARGILFWGTHYVDRNAQLWKDLLSFANEIKSLLPILSAEEDPIPVSIQTEEIFGSGDRGIVVRVKLLESKPYVLIVNEWHECGIRYFVKSPRFKSGQRYKEFYSGVEIEVVGQTLSHGIENFGVQIWKPMF